MSKRLQLGFLVTDADGTTRRMRLTGQFARTMQALTKAGPAGITALEVSSWALRLGHYIHILRRRHGMEIDMIRERHDGEAGPGWHGRYRLRSNVRLIGPATHREAA